MQRLKESTVCQQLGGFRGFLEGFGFRVLLLLLSHYYYDFSFFLFFFLGGGGLGCSV